MPLLPVQHGQMLQQSLLHSLIAQCCQLILWCCIDERCFGCAERCHKQTVNVTYDPTTFIDAVNESEAKIGFGINFQFKYERNLKPSWHFIIYQIPRGSQYNNQNPNRRDILKHIRQHYWSKYPQTGEQTILTTDNGINMVEKKLAQTLLRLRVEINSILMRLSHQDWLLFRKRICSHFTTRRDQLITRSHPHFSIFNLAIKHRSNNYRFTIMNSNNLISHDQIIN